MHCSRTRCRPRSAASRFGLHRAFDNAGAVVGPLLAAALLALHVPIRDILLWAALPGALCVALALALREPDQLEAPQERRPEWTFGTLPGAFRRMLVALALFTLGQASNAFILLRATELGMAPTRVALLWAVVAATSTLLSVPLSAWSDRIGRVPLLIGGWSVHALLFVALALVGEATLLWPIAVLLGLYMAATEGAERALIADLVTSEFAGQRLWLVLPHQGSAAAAGLGGFRLDLARRGCVDGILQRSVGRRAGHGAARAVGPACRTSAARTLRPLRPVRPGATA